MTERTIEDVQKIANQLTDESLESTERMVKLTAHTSEVGKEILSNLHTQRETLLRIEQKTGQINSNMTKADREIEKMEKCCGCFSNPFKSKRTKFKNKQVKNAFKPINETDIERTIKEPNLKDHNSNDIGQMIVHVTNDEREDKMEKNLHIVHGAVREIRHQAVTMSNEIDEQDAIIDRLGHKLDNNNTRINNSTKRVINLL